MKHTIQELRQLLSNLKAVEMRDDMDTLNQWEDYRDDSELEDVYDACKGIIEATDSLDEYYNSL